MRSYTFKWPHDAEEVYVTGTFDNWTKSERLERVGQVFQKTVTLPESADKIFYKFVVDGNWTTDHVAPQEKDHEGNDNNVLLPEQMDNLEEASQAAAINNLVPESTTAQLAGAVPLEDKREEEKQEDKNEDGQDASSGAAILSSAAPDSTTAQLAAAVPPEEKKDDHTPPGGFPETPAAELQKEVKIDPLPAAERAINPIKLGHGENVPKDLTAGAVDSHVTLDKESYEKSDRIPGIETTLPFVTGSMIPESSLPITGANDANINTVTAESTTAKLAGEVPLEPKVPEIVKQSQEEAKVEPEASANSEEVKDKAAVEEELLDKVAEAPSTSEGTAGKGTEKSEADKTAVENVIAATTTAGEVALGAAITAAGVAIPVAADAATKASGVASDVAQKASDAAIDLASKVTAAASDAATNVPAAVKGVLPGAAQAEAEEKHKAAIDSVSPEVPAEVKESLKEAGESPEAAVNTAAVEEKKGYEAELLEKVKPADAINGVSSQVPAQVKDSIEEAGQSPEAAANSAAVEEKKGYEAELLEKVGPAKAIDESSAKPANEVKPAEEHTATEENKAVAETKSEESLPKPMEEPAPAETPQAETKPKPAEEGMALAVEPPQSVEAVKTVDEAKSAETPKPADEVKPGDLKLAEDIAPAVSAVAVEPPKPAETVKAVDVAQPTDAAKVAVEPKAVGPTAASEPAKAAADEPKPAEAPKPTVEHPAATESAAPAETAKKTDEAHPASNGSTTAPPASKSAETSTSEKKKKHRISGFFNKLKHKFA